jgi:hypothetical protein
MRDCGVRADKKDKSWRCRETLRPPKPVDIQRMMNSYFVLVNKRRGTIDAWLTYVLSGQIGWLVYDAEQFDKAVPPLLEEVAKQCGTAWGYIESDEARARMKALGYDVDDETQKVVLRLEGE